MDEAKEDLQDNDKDTGAIPNQVIRRARTSIPVGLRHAARALY